MTDILNPETHPSYGWVSAHRGNGGKPYLLGSAFEPINHITLIVSNSKITGDVDLYKDLHTEQIYESSQIVEVCMTESQWMDLLTKMNHGGTPATIKRLGNTLIAPHKYLHPATRNKENFRAYLEGDAKAAKDLDGKIAKLLLQKRVTKADLTELQGLSFKLSQNLNTNIPYYLRLILEFSQNTIAQLARDACSSVKNLGQSYRKAIKETGLKD